MNLPGNPGKGYGPVWRAQWEQSGWWHSFELPGGEVIRGVNPLASQKYRLAQFPIPDDLRGKRVLDIGAWDGWFSFEMERRGAQVVALDAWDNPRFHEIRRIYNSHVEFRQMDVMEIAPETIGRFDIVLFFGVLYHLKHPLLALEKVCSVTTEIAAVDSFVLRNNFDPEAQPVLEFYETDEMEGQTDNWVAPNLACLMAMCRTAGFARAELRNVLPYSACVACYRRWEPENPDGPRAELTSATHYENYGINFDTHRDEYVGCAFKHDQTGLTVKDIQTAVSGFGVRPIVVKSLGGDLWQANFKLPPGLQPGWHPVGLSVRGGPVATGPRIAVDVPIPPCSLRIEGVRDGTTWKENTLDPKFGRHLALWCSGLPENSDRNNLRIFLSRVRCPVEFVSIFSDIMQVNVSVPELDEGSCELTLSIGDSSTKPVIVRVLSTA